MLRRGVENKAAGEEFIATSGRRFRRSDLENPSRPGYLRDELCPIKADVWNAAAHLNLLSPSGRRMGYLPTSRDPFTVRREEAPPELLASAAAAWAELERVVEENAAERERLLRDERARAQASSESMSLDELTIARAFEKESSSLFVGVLDRGQIAPLEAREGPARQKFAQAEAKVAAWIRFETIRRQKAAHPDPPRVERSDSTVQRTGR